MVRDNRTTNALQAYEQAANKSAVEIGLRTLIAGIPYAGGPMLEIFGGVAQGRVQRRLNHVLRTMDSILRDLDASKVDRDFFQTEEFQTLIYLIIEKLATIHNTEKLKALGTALAKSGEIEFRNDDKELFIRVLRDLTIGDLNILADDKLTGWFPYTHRIEYGDHVLVSLSRLVAFGLVYERLNVKNVSEGRTGSTTLDAQVAIKDLLTNPPKRSFHLSSFGERFLKFISESSPSEQTA